MIKLADFLQKFKKNKKNGQIIERHYKFKTPLSFKIKRLLRWFDLRDDTGNPLVHSDTDMNDVLSTWSKSFLLWFFRIYVIGLLLYLAILPFWAVPFHLVPFVMFSLGLLYYVVMEANKELRDIWRKKHNG